jgi:hypothetical protein
VVVDKQSKQIICTSFSNGKRHDFRLFKESRTQIHPKTSIITDSGYQGLQKRHAQTQMPKKRTKKQPLTKEEKKTNQNLASQRVLNENVIGSIKRFKIVADRYRNRRRRFGLRFNLISAVVNFELK